MKINDIYDKFPKQTWILAEVTRENERNEVEEIEPIFSSPERDEVYKKIGEVKKGTHVTTLYTGPIMEEGKAFAFWQT